VRVYVISTGVSKSMNVIANPVSLTKMILIVCAQLTVIAKSFY